MKSSKNIVWLVPGFASDENDEQCIPPLQLLIIELEKNYPDYHISVIAFHYPFTVKAYKWRNSTVYPCNGRNKKGFRKIILWKRAVNVFKKLIDKQKIDLIHSFWFSECMLVGNYLANRYEIPHINTLMGQDVLPSNKYLKRIYTRKVPAIAISERQSEFYKNNTSFPPIKIIPWGIDEEQINMSGKIEYDIIAVGSLIPLKQYDLLLRVTVKLKKAFPQIKIIIVGEGTEMNYLKKVANELDILENVVFAGSVKRSQVMHLMTQSKLFVHTSEYESFGFVFLEAMKCGLPIVSFAVGIAEEKDNWFIAKSEDDMTETLKNILANKINRTQQIPFTISNTASKYISIYPSYIK